MNREGAKFVAARYTGGGDDRGRGDRRLNDRSRSRPDDRRDYGQHKDAYNKQEWRKCREDSPQGLGDMVAGRRMQVSPIQGPRRKATL